jgi:hypothetical protein
MIGLRGYFGTLDDRAARGRIGAGLRTLRPDTDAPVFTIPPTLVAGTMVRVRAEARLATFNASSAVPPPDARNPSERA